MSNQPLAPAPAPPPQSTLSASTLHNVDHANHAQKRKRSPSFSKVPSPAPKFAKTTPNQLSINYIARSSNEDLPLATKEESLPNLLHLLTLYNSVLDRHESIASNLGARPLGPILIKRFERCFDGPPKVVATHQRAASTAEDALVAVTWLEVIEFARSHPAQFSLSSFSEGRRVCQFYLPQKQVRVQISEEDFIFINSGRCQELIPPLPIWEDEEKEVSTCDVLEIRLKELTNVADMVAARTRQLCHRLKGRKAAILGRRAEGGSGTPAKAILQQTTTAHPPHPPASPFANSAPAHVPSIIHHSAEEAAKLSAATRMDLLRHLESLPQNQAQSFRPVTIPPAELTPDRSRQSNVIASDNPSTAPRLERSNTTEPQQRTLPSMQTSPPSEQRASISAASSTPTTAAAASMKHNFSRPLTAALENSQPHRLFCQAHMEHLPRGQRVIPPCDRCRRLKMDCVKHLTSCAGCTKKHARCHWKDVTADEISGLDKSLANNFSMASHAIDEERSGSTDYDDDDGADDLDDDDANDNDDGDRLNGDRLDGEALRRRREFDGQWERDKQNHQQREHEEPWRQHGPARSMDYRQQVAMHDMNSRFFRGHEQHSQPQKQHSAASVKQSGSNPADHTLSTNGINLFRAAQTSPHPPHASPIATELGTTSHRNELLPSIQDSITASKTSSSTIGAFRAVNTMAAGHSTLEDSSPLRRG